MEIPWEPYLLPSIMEKVLLNHKKQLLWIAPYSYLLLAPQQKNQQQQAAIAEASRAAANAGRNQFSHLSLAAKSLKFITTPMWNYTYCIQNNKPSILLLVCDLHTK